MTRFLAGPFAALLLLAACGEVETAEAPPEPPRVTVARPEQREVTEWDEFTARFVAVERVELRARVSGYLNSYHFSDGQVVRQGELLFRIDPRPFEAAVAAAEGRVAEARSRATLADRELERVMSLLRARAASESNLEQRTQAVEGGRASLAEAEAQLRRARLDLEFTSIRSPISGRIGRHQVSPGNLVAGGQDGASTLLATIVSIDPIDAAFDIDQATGLRYARMVGTGTRPSSRDSANPVRLALGDEEGFPHRGQVVFVDNEADLGTGTLRLRARFDNPNQVFQPGLFARVRLLSALPYQALLVPDAAIATDQSRRVVYVLGPNNQVTMREVRLGALHDDLRVIRGGLGPDDEVVVNGLSRIRAGRPVTPERPTMMSPAVRP
jgi:membrane fusion protein, multidrug efflux system